MPVLIPVAPAGERVVTVNVGPETLRFRTYFVSGQDAHWLLDMADAQERPLIGGINLVPGVDNLLKGMGDALDGYTLRLLVESGSEKDPEALGHTMHLVWFGPDEAAPATTQDPMDGIGADLW